MSKKSLFHYGFVSFLALASTLSQENFAIAMEVDPLEGQKIQRAPVISLILDVPSDPTELIKMIQGCISSNSETVDVQPLFSKISHIPNADKLFFNAAIKYFRTGQLFEALTYGIDPKTNLMRPEMKMKTMLPNLEDEIKRWQPYGVALAISAFLFNKNAQDYLKIIRESNAAFLSDKKNKKYSPLHFLYNPFAELSNFSTLKKESAKIELREAFLQKNYPKCMEINDYLAKATKLNVDNGQNNQKLFAFYKWRFQLLNGILDDFEKKVRTEFSDLPEALNILESEKDQYKQFCSQMSVLYVEKSKVQHLKYKLEANKLLEAVEKISSKKTKASEKLEETHKTQKMIEFYEWYIQFKNKEFEEIHEKVLKDELFSLSELLDDLNKNKERIFSYTFFEKIRSLLETQAKVSDDKEGLFKQYLNIATYVEKMDDRELYPKVAHYMKASYIASSLHEKRDCYLKIASLYAQDPLLCAIKEDFASLKNTHLEASFYAFKAAEFCEKEANKKDVVRQACIYLSDSIRTTLFAIKMYQQNNSYMKLLIENLPVIKTLDLPKETLDSLNLLLPKKFFFRALKKSLIKV